MQEMVPIHLVSFSVADIGVRLKEAIRAFNASEPLRTCKRCGASGAGRRPIASGKR